MTSFKSFLVRRQERREELYHALNTIGKNQPFIGDANTEALRKGIISRHVSDEIRDLVEKHLGPNAISSALGLNSHSKR